MRCLERQCVGGTNAPPQVSSSTLVVQLESSLLHQALPAVQFLALSPTLEPTGLSVSTTHLTI